MIGTSFLRVAAHDDDFGTNAAVTYSISQEQPEYLRVNPVTGWVYVNQPISQVSQPDVNHSVNQPISQVSLPSVNQPMSQVSHSAGQPASCSSRVKLIRAGDTAI